jgi:hypothetical protein
MRLGIDWSLLSARPCEFAQQQYERDPIQPLREGRRIRRLCQNIGDKKNQYLKALFSWQTVVVYMRENSLLRDFKTLRVFTGLKMQACISVVPQYHTSLIESCPHLHLNHPQTSMFWAFCNI